MNYCINVHDFFLNDQTNELDSDLYVRICGYHFYHLSLLHVHLAHNTVWH